MLPATAGGERREYSKRPRIRGVRAEECSRECEARMEQRLQNAILEAKISLIKWMIATMMVFSGIVIGAVTALQ